MAPATPRPCAVVCSNDDVPPVESLKGHLAFEVARSKHAEAELWQAYAKLASCYQSLVLQFEWMKRRQWILIVVACLGQLLCWLLGVLVFRVLT